MGDCAAVPDTRPAAASRRRDAARAATSAAAAKNIEAVLAGHQKSRLPLSTIGQLASIGHRRGVANILGINFSGFIAWCLWEALSAQAPALRRRPVWRSRGCWR